MEKRRAVKKTPLRRRGGRLFPQSPEDKAYWDWFIKQRSECEVCGYYYASAAHLTPRGSGGKDRNNLVWLDEDHVGSDGVGVQGCHTKQEGRVDAFIHETGVDLWAIAAQHTRRFDSIQEPKK